MVRMSHIRTVSFLLTLLLPLVAASVHRSEGSRNDGDIPHSRKKRVIYYTSERRLTLPPTTLLLLTPTLSLPFARDLPLGYGASMTISIPFKVAFDDLGLTSEENPWGLWPDLKLFRKKREAFTPLPGVNFAGGDREMMFQVVEDSLHNMGMDGKACLMRAICEMFQYPLVNHGFFGEVLELFFSVSRAPHSEKRLPDYAKAERIGRSTGECFEYHKKCPHSLFTNPGQLKWIEAEANMNHYSNDTTEDNGNKETYSVEYGEEATEDDDKPFNFSKKFAGKTKKKTTQKDIN